MSCKLTGLSLHLAILSLSAIGGGVVLVAPDVHDYVAVQNHWLTSEEFAAVYALAQAAPGPNVLFVTLVGWLIAGMKGALATTAAVVLPSSLIALGAARLAWRSKAGKQARDDDPDGRCKQLWQDGQGARQGQGGTNWQGGRDAQDVAQARPSRWAQALRAAIAPLSAGMLAAAGWSFLNMANAGVLAIALALAAAVVVYATKINPVWLVALGALAGLAGAL